MKHCPNPDCPFVRSHAAQAEYRDAAESCSDCGTALVEGAPDRPPAAAPRATAAVWRRLAVTVGIPAAVVAIDRIALARFPGGDVGPMMLGITPVVSAFVVSELAALAIPRLRHLREGSREGRVLLLRIAYSIAFLLTGLQAVSVAVALRHVLPPYEVETPFFVLVVTLMAGTAIAIAAARAIDGWGLGSGFLALLVPGHLTALYQLARHAALTPPATIAIAAGMLFALAVASGWMLRWSGRGPIAIPHPACGLVPVSQAGSLIIVATMLATMLGGPITVGGPLYALLIAVLIVSLGFALTYAFQGPVRLAAVRRDKTIEEARDSVRRAAWSSIAFLVLSFLALWWVGSIIGLPLHPVLTSVPVLVAVLLDLRGDWRALRDRPDLVPVWPLHRMYRLDPALLRLERAGIPAHAKSRYVRTLLQFFGPYAPVVLLVPRDRVTDAEAILRETPT